jgi:SPOR domain
VRALFLLLALANVVFLAWSRYVAPPEAAADPAPLGRQIEPQKLKVIAPADLPPLAARPAPVVLKCIEWGSFTLADASLAQAALEPLQLGGRLAQRRTEESAGWWVFIAPQGSRPAAQKKAAELKALAVDDYFVVQEEGPYRWALSLGVFRSEEAAQARLTALRAQGVRSAQVGARETTISKVWLQVKAVDAGLYARLKEMARGMDGTELRDCTQ